MPFACPYGDSNVAWQEDLHVSPDESHIFVKRVALDGSRRTYEKLNMLNGFLHKRLKSDLGMCVAHMHFSKQQTRRKSSMSAYIAMLCSSGGSES